MLKHNTKILINDILIDHHSHNLLKFAYSYVGNRRFEIMLQIYRKQFSHAMERGDERSCLNILVNIVDTICHKVIPNGRFLEYSYKFDIWYDVGDGEIARMRVRKGLMGYLSNRIPDFCESKHKKPIMKISQQEKYRIVNLLRNFEKGDNKDHVDLNDDRFLVNDTTLLANIKLPRGRRISSKIKRTVGEKAICAGIKVKKRQKLEYGKNGKIKKQYKKVLNSEISVISVLEEETKMVYKNNIPSCDNNKTKHLIDLLQAPQISNPSQANWQKYNEFCIDNCVKGNNNLYLLSHVAEHV